MRRLTLLLAAAQLLVVAACSDSGGSETAEADGSDVPSVVMAASELEALETEAVALFDRWNEDWPDLEARFSDFADDAMFFDPTFGDYFIGPEQIIRGWAQMPAAFPDLEAQIESVFLGREEAVLVVEWVNLWLGDKPAEVPWPAGLEVYRFDGDQVAEAEIWYTIDTLEGPMLSCDGCAIDLRSLAASYVAAWSSGDADEVASLYSEDAVVLDSMFGIEANGVDEIAQLREDRFGPPEAMSETSEPYGILVASVLIQPDSGAASGDVIGVAVRFGWAAGGEGAQMESLALLYFGSIEERRYRAHPDSLIVREEMFHNPDSLKELAP